MSANSFGQHFVVTTFGESHGSGLGCVIDGCPANINFSESILTHELERRRPGRHASRPNAPSTTAYVSQRNEADVPEVLSGVFEGKTLGTPIAIFVKNSDARSQDYATLKNSPRAGHADDVWKNKFLVSDHRGGGRSSGRETVARVMAGSVAFMVLKELAPHLGIHAYLSQMGTLSLTSSEEESFRQVLNAKQNDNQKTTEIDHPIDRYFARFPKQNSDESQKALELAQSQGESFAATLKVVIKNVPAHLGQPVFHKLKADLARAVMGIGAVTAFELGEGSKTPLGSEFHQTGRQDQYGGIRGGISTGEDILFSLKIKPTSSILDVAKKGRHDPCIGIRAIPVVESMVALVLVDHLLWTRLDRAF